MRITKSKKKNEEEEEKNKNGKKEKKEEEKSKKRTHIGTSRLSCLSQLRQPRHCRTERDRLISAGGTTRQTMRKP